MKRFYFLFSLLMVSPFALAQKDARKTKVDARKPLRIEYVAPAWNKNPKISESAALIVRDALSGKLVKVELSETGDDSSEFVGNYQLNFQERESAPAEFTPEVYLAPQAMLKADQKLQRIDSLIKEGSLLRKPYFLRVEKGISIISIYDSKAQALEAYQSFLKNGSGKPLVDPAAFDAQNTAQKSIEDRKRLDLIAEAQLLRAKMELEEKARQEELQRKSAMLSDQEKERRRAEAVKLSQEALENFKKNELLEAEKKFAKASDLDPDNHSYAFQYGVTLYQLEKFDKSIVILKTAEGPNVNASERDYYRALAHMKLKEYEEGYRLFNDLKSKNDPATSPLAAFYAGVIDFQKEQYPSAKSNFEYVLDNSKDPKMDQQADVYIEQIANLMRFEEMRKKKWILGLNMGLLYDSNILSVSSSSPSAPTDLAGFRWAYGGSVEYRPIFSEKHEFSGVLALSDMYSTDTGMKAKTEFQNTDPLVMNISFPYKYKGIVLEKPAQLGLTPAYETITMNAESTGRKAIVNSTIVKGDGTFVMKEDQFANYALELRSDKSLLSGSTGDDDQTASKITLSTTQTFFQDQKKTRAIIGEGALATNMAVGANQKYNRIDLAGSYLMPAPWESIFLGRLAFGSAQYPSHTTGRSDSSYGLTLVLQKQFSPEWGGNLMTTFNKNSSSISTNAYDKYTIMAGLSWKDMF